MNESLEKFFSPFRRNIIILDASFETFYGRKKVSYANWIASGRLYRLKNEFSRKIYTEKAKEEVENWFLL